MKPGYILKTWRDMDFVFPHWSIYGLFWGALIILPMPTFFSAYVGSISYKTGYALTVYITFIFSLVYFLAAFNGYKYTHTHGKGVNNYQHQRNKIVAIMVPMGAATLYFTGYLITIPFGQAPNYIFTLKPSPQLEMELNHLLGDDTIEYTPFDYSLDEQEITYVTDGVRSKFFEVISRPRRYPDKIVALETSEVEYLSAIEKLEPFSFKVLAGTCFLSAQVRSFISRTIDHTKFEFPIDISKGQKGEMLVNVSGAYEVRFETVAIGTLLALTSSKDTLSKHTYNTRL